MNLKYSFDILVLRRRSFPATKRRGDEVSQRQNDWRQNVPATKWLATKCPRDEMASDEVSLRRMASDETAATKGGVPRQKVFKKSVKVLFKGICKKLARNYSRNDAKRLQRTT